MLHLLLLAFLGGLFVLGLMLAIALVSGWTPSDGRDIVLNRAFHTVIEDGVRLEGVRLPRLASVAIRLLADENDARLLLIANQGDRTAKPRESTAERFVRSAH